MNIIQGMYCSRCGLPATSFYRYFPAGGAVLAGCDDHSVFPPANASSGGYSVFTAAQHTWTARCDGFHAPGPCAAGA